MTSIRTSHLTKDFGALRAVNEITLDLLLPAPYASSAWPSPRRSWREGT